MAIVESVGEKTIRVFSEHIIRECAKKIKDVHYTYKAWIVGPGFRYQIYMLESIDIHRDFVSNYTDIVTIEGLMDVKEYFNVVSEFSNDTSLIECHLERYQMAENSVHPVYAGKKELKKYGIFIPDPPTSGLGRNDKSNEPQRIENPRQNVMKVKFQLIEKTSIQLRYARWSGILQDSKPGESAALIMDGALSDYGIEDVIMVEPDIKEIRQIVIPQSTYLKDVPHYLQENYGIYNTGIGSYRLEEKWYIYSLYDINRWKKERYRISISVIDRKWLQMESPRTYYTHLGELIMYTTDPVKTENIDHEAQLNTGTGLQIVNPQESQTKVTKEIGPNKWALDGSNGLSTFNLIDRKDGLKNTIRIPHNSQNFAKHISRIMANKGIYIEVVWRNANYKLLLPGMPVKVMFIEDNRREVYGILHEFHAVLLRENKMPVDSTFPCHVRMRIYVESLRPEQG